MMSMAPSTWLTQARRRRPSLAQAVSAAAIFIGDNREAVTALRSDGRRNCSNHCLTCGLTV
jgi:hypothetical protein